MNDFERAKTVLKGAEYILVGGGSGLSAAAGLTYSGARFKKFFSDFIERYRMTDMYSAGFYPFSAQEEKWAYWSKHIFVNRYLPPALPLYRDLFSFLENKNYFVITTNVDHQFYKAGFQTEKIFAVQGDYGKFQCANGWSFLFIRQRGGRAGNGTQSKRLPHSRIARARLSRLRRRYGSAYP